jgi:hypothetical protein
MASGNSGPGGSVGTLPVNANVILARLCVARGSSSAPQLSIFKTSISQGYRYDTSFSTPWFQN